MNLYNMKTILGDEHAGDDVLLFPPISNQSNCEFKAFYHVFQETRKDIKLWDYAMSP